MVPYVVENAQRFSATLTPLNAFNLMPDYILAPDTEGMGDTQLAAIPYAPASGNFAYNGHGVLRSFPVRNSQA